MLDSSYFWHNLIGGLLINSWSLVTFLTHYLYYCVIFINWNHMYICTEIKEESLLQYSKYSFIDYRISKCKIYTLLFKQLNHIFCLVQISMEIQVPIQLHFLPYTAIITTTCLHNSVLTYCMLQAYTLLESALIVLQLL